ncbi:SDR family NAD(P)-dependent oxidoreductase [Streptomyces sp. NPDC058335]|uniref:SDR family NAD(P)-dependent oxidoreductase n=1 Tax=Streptomyces sp. NPDC058335 TaxID=3346451 RepID=UPI00365F59DF
METVHAPVALITGGGTGFGAATAELLTAQGWNVAICGRRPGPLASVAARTGALDLVADLIEPGACADVVDRTVAQFGRLDGLVLNAGVQRLGDLESTTLEDWDLIMKTNVTGPFLIAKRALPSLLASGGRVVAVSSVAAVRTALGMTAYGTSKAALTSLALSLAVEYGPRGLRANVVCPGWGRTEMADDEMAVIGSSRGLDVDAAYDLVTSLVPMRRAGWPKEVAEAIVWLLSDGSSYVNGATLTVDGGHTALDPGTVPFDPRVTIQG